MAREPVAPEAAGLSAVQLLADPNLPISIQSINRLNENAKQRIYRTLLPPDLLIQFNIDPIHWKGPDKRHHVQLNAGADKGVVNIEARHTAVAPDPFFSIELADNSFNGIDLNLLVAGDPRTPRFDIDRDNNGRNTLFGTIHRNVAAEEQAMRAGLAPGQVHVGLSVSRQALAQIEVFLTAVGHRAYYLEPLTYVSAWLFERRGFAYVSGHQLMDEIQREFQPDGRLHQALDGRSPFRQPEQWRTVRGRAWAIHDGILEVLDGRWNGLRMVKRLGRDAKVNTFPDAVY